MGLSQITSSVLLTHLHKLLLSVTVIVITFFLKQEKRLHNSIKLLDPNIV